MNLSLDSMWEAVLQCDTRYDGLRPCKRCRPDLDRTSGDQAAEFLDQTLRILETEYHHPGILNQLSVRVGVSPFHLQRTFKKQTGVTPRQYLQKVRIQQVEQFLRDSRGNHTEICFAVGFRSLSGFYAAFRAHTGHSPGQHKQRNQSTKREV